MIAIGPFGDRSCDQPVLRQDAGRVGFGGLTAHEADHAVVVVHERRIAGADELGIVDGDIRQARRRERLNGGHAVRQKRAGDDRRGQELAYAFLTSADTRV